MFRDRKTFQDRTGNDCLNTTPVAREIIVYNNKLANGEGSKPNSFCTAKETIRNEQTAYRLREKFYQLFIHQAIIIQNTWRTLKNVLQ